jgi:hypothetical protein
MARYNNCIFAYGYMDAEGNSSMTTEYTIIVIICK